MRITYDKSAPPRRLAEVRIEPVDILLYLLATAFVDNLAPHHASRVSEPVAGRRQFALDAVHTLAEYDLHAVGSLAEDHHVHGLPGLRYAYLDLFGIHQVILAQSNSPSRKFAQLLFKIGTDFDAVLRRARGELMAPIAGQAHAVVFQHRCDERLDALEINIASRESRWG